MRVVLLTGGHDRSYAVGLTLALTKLGVHVTYIGSNDTDAPELHESPYIEFLNLRGSQSENVPFWQKVSRLFRYYVRLLRLGALARAPIFHILWNNKVEWFDRTLLTLYYKLFGRQIVLTVHNVNAASRDASDSAFNRWTLRLQYRMAAHLFVHTQKMADELSEKFGVSAEKITVISFGINNTNARTALTQEQARNRLGLASTAKVGLFFGQIAPYKGLEYLLAAMREIVVSDGDFRLIVAGKVKKGHEGYWEDNSRRLEAMEHRDRVLTRIEHIQDSEVEVYFKAADVLIVPYTAIFQSGVPFLAYSFGVPVIATDVGSLREDIVEGTTGLICRPRDPHDLARAVTCYFAGESYRCRATQRMAIQNFANEKYSWAKTATATMRTYAEVSKGTP